MRSAWETPHRRRESLASERSFKVGISISFVVEEFVNVSGFYEDIIFLCRGMKIRSRNCQSRSPKMFAGIEEHVQEQSCQDPEVTLETKTRHVHIHRIQ